MITPTFGIIFIISILAGLPIFITNLIYYGIYVSPLGFVERPLRPNALPNWTFSIVVAIAYALSLLRLPFIILPYLGKLVFFLLFKERYSAVWSAYSVQVLRLLGDFVNFIVTTILMMALIQAINGQNLIMTLVVWTSLVAELVRLVSEKGQTAFIGFWQLIPHRQIATFLIRKNRTIADDNWLGRYTSYYHLSPADRATTILEIAQKINLDKSDVFQKLSYARNFRIVPERVGLRAGIVRDVARGEIYIHETWTNDPWLMMGQFFRRSLWIFDPRLMKRPFYYRSESNRLMTHFVLKNSRYTFPYCWYQFGQEVKVARYDIFFKIMRWLGIELEGFVKEDGSYVFDPFLDWFGRQIGIDVGRENKADLWDDDAVVNYLVSHCQAEEVPSDQEIASRFTFPLAYVQEILRPKIVSCLAENEQQEMTVV